MGMPRRRPTAIHNTSSSIRNPTEDSGSAFNHAPVSLAETAKGCAQHLVSNAFSRRYDHVIMWLEPAVYPVLSVLCLMVEQEKLSLGFHPMLTWLPQLQDKE